MVKPRSLYFTGLFSVVAALSLMTACGKQNGATPHAGSAPIADGAVAGKTTGAAVAGAQDKQVSELDQGSGSSASHSSDDRGTTNVGSVFNSEPDPTIVAEPASGTITTQEAAVEKVRAMDSRVESVIYYDPSGMTPDQIFTKKAQVRASGAVVGERVASDITSGSGQTLFYSGASHDTLREQLYLLVNDYESKLDSVQRSENKALAQSIQLSNFSVNWKTRQGFLAFQYLRNGRKATVEMEGAVSDVMQFEGGSLTKAPYIKAEAACMDIAGGCRTVHIKVQDMSSGQLRTAHMLARHTSATLFIEGNPPGVTRNAEYDRLMTLLLSTAKKQKINSVKKLTLTTSETIGGASNFWITMDFDLLGPSGQKEYDQLQITGPLAKPQGSDLVDVAAVVSPEFTVARGYVLPVEGRIVDTIRSARLLKNDGEGNLQIRLNVRKATIDAVEDQITLTVARIHTPTVQLRLPVK